MSWDAYSGNLPATQMEAATTTAAAPPSGDKVAKPPVVTSYESPNHNSRNGTPIDAIVIHHTGSDNCSGTLSWLKNPSAQASAHYVIDKDGTIYQMVGDDKRAWHAGQGSIPGNPGDVNSRSLGIEIVNAGDGKTPFTDAQYASLSQLTAHLQQEYDVPQQNILGHKDVSPGRKTDPAENFDWNRLWNGMGTEATKPSTPSTPSTPTAPSTAPPATSKPTLKNGSSGAEVTQMQQLLDNAGFNTKGVDGKFGANTSAALKAFQKANGLAADGVCGPKTWAALQNAAPGGTKAASTEATKPSHSSVPATDIASLDAACANIPGYANNPNVTPEFKAKTIEIANKLGIDPKVMVSIMAFESGLNPSRKNMAGSGATGLIQFMPSTANSLGTTTDKLGKMSSVEQLDYVEKYFSQPHLKGKINSVADAYMAVLWPAAVGKPMDHVLFSAGSKAYEQNKGLDLDKDGNITKEEASRKVRKFAVEI
jgi:N-acetylmuramoyl-L-alanine amidase